MLRKRRKEKEKKNYKKQDEGEEVKPNEYRPYSMVLFVLPVLAALFKKS
jgi:hypothetical protein